MPATKEYMQKYAQENKEKLSAYKLAWKKEKLNDPEYREHQNKLQRLRRAKNGPNEEQLAKSRARTAKWKLQNKGKVLADTKKRKLSKRNRTPSWLTAGDLFEIECIYTYCTALRSIGLNYEVDHIVPLIGKNISGLHVPTNLQVILASENRAKSNKVKI